MAAWAGPPFAREATACAGIAAVRSLGRSRPASAAALAFGVRPSSFSGQDGQLLLPNFVPYGLPDRYSQQVNCFDQCFGRELPNCYFYARPLRLPRLSGFAGQPFACRCNFCHAVLQPGRWP